MTTLITRSIYGSSLQTTQYLQLPYTLVPNSTLNEKFNVQSGVAPSGGKIPAVGYFAIGKGGHTFSVGTNNTAVIQPIKHAMTDAALYDHLPFILRPINSDLSTADQASYALRTILTIGGQQYVAYYLKRLNKAGVNVSMTIDTISNGVTTSTAFVPSAANLSPSPTNVTGAGAVTLESEYGATSAPLSISFTANECQELLNAATILYGDPSYAIISEIAVCSGVDQVVNLAGGGTFNEAIAVQCATFINTFHAIQYTATGMTGNYDVGSSGALLIAN